MNDIPDSFVDQVLGDVATLQNINQMLQANGVSNSFETLPREQQKDILGQILAQQQAAQQGGGIQVDLAALGVSREQFDEIWQTSQEEAAGDIGRLEDIIKAKLTEAGAPEDAIGALVDQFPKPNGQG